MKKLALVLFGVSVLLMVIAAATFFVGQVPLEKQELYTSVNVTLGKIGFDVNDSALTFGNLANPGSSTRVISFRNDRHHPIILDIGVDGNIEPILDYEDRIFMEAGESRQIAFSARADGSIDYGFYDGVIGFKVLSG
jgi:hypothetical protein